MLAKKIVGKILNNLPLTLLKLPHYGTKLFLTFLLRKRWKKRSTEENTIDSIKIIISFTNPQHSNLFSNDIKFKLRKYIYLYLTALDYTPNFIAVSEQQKPIIPTIEKPPTLFFAVENFIVEKKAILVVLLLLLFILLTIVFYIRKALIKQKKLEEKQKKNRHFNQHNNNENEELSPYPSYEDIATSTANMTLMNESELDIKPPIFYSDESADLNDGNSDLLQEEEQKQLNAQLEVPKNLKKALYNQILNSTAKHPYFLRKMYELWQQINHSSSNSFTPYLGDKVAIMYDVLGEETLKKTIPIVEESQFTVLNEKSQTLNSDAEKWELVYQEIQQDIKKLEQHLDNPDPYQNPFGFIKAMPDQAIILLLNNKAQHIQSITLAQFDVARCQSLALHIAANSEAHQKMVQQIETLSPIRRLFFSRCCRLSGLLLNANYLQRQHCANRLRF